MHQLSVVDKNQLIKLEYPRRWLSSFKSNKERQMPHFPRTKECPFFTGRCGNESMSLAPGSSTEQWGINHDQPGNHSSSVMCCENRLPLGTAPRRSRPAP